MRRAKHLVVFVKAPRLGAVKTRLAADIGAVPAWRLYRRLTGSVLRRLLPDGRWTCWLAVTPDRYVTRGRFWPPRVRRLAQGPGDLGERMARPLRRLPPGPVVIVGSDIPDLSADHVAAAFRTLGRAEVVFGPNPDGGYWLLGASRRRAAPDLFRGVRWSTAHALADTVANLGPSWRRVQLSPLADIDIGADLRPWRGAGIGPG